MFYSANELVNLRKDALETELLLKSNRLFAQQQIHLDIRSIELTAQLNALKGKLKGGRTESSEDPEYVKKMQQLEELQEENSQLKLIYGAVIDVNALKQRLKTLSSQAEMARDRYFEECLQAFSRKSKNSFSSPIISLQSEVDQLVAENQRLMLRLSGEQTRLARNAVEIQTIKSKSKQVFDGVVMPKKEKQETSISLDLASETPNISKYGIEDASDVQELMTLKQELQQACRNLASKEEEPRPHSRLSFIELNAMKSRFSPEFVLPKSKGRLSPGLYSPVSRPKSHAKQYKPSHTRVQKPLKQTIKPAVKKPISALKLRSPK